MYRNNVTLFSQTIGRPREHDERTAAALLAAAERLVQDGGPDAVSIRAVASAVGTTTRAVYSLYGSKQGLMDALAVHAFDLLRDGVSQLPATQAPVDDLVEAGLIFRRFAVEHPSLFRIAFGSTRDGPIRARPLVRNAAGVALDVLKTRIARLADARLIDSDRIDKVTLHFDASAKASPRSSYAARSRPTPQSSCGRTGSPRSYAVSRALSFLDQHTRVPRSHGQTRLAQPTSNPPSSASSRSYGVRAGGRAFAIGFRADFSIVADGAASHGLLLSPA